MALQEGELSDAERNAWRERRAAARRGPVSKYPDASLCGRPKRNEIA